MIEHPPTLTARELHEKGGVSLPYAYQLMSGLRRPSLEVALRLQTELGIDPAVWPLPRKPKGAEAA